MATDVIAPRITVEEFLRLCEEDEDKYRHCELIDGEIYPRTMPGSPHDLVKNNLKELFDRSGVDRDLFRCWIEHTFRMTDSSVLIPDVAIARAERLLHHDGFTAGAPEIPFEVAINDNAGLLLRKIDLYLGNGAIAVCCAYPEIRSIVIYTPNRWRELKESDTLEFPDLLPGMTIPVASVFEGV